MKRHQPDIPRPAARTPRAEPPRRELDTDPAAIVLRKPLRIHPF